MMISEHFSLEDLTRSSTATRLDISNVPDERSISNLKLLCKFILEPLYETFGDRLIITSVYRSPELNRAIGGALKSQHTTGSACDSIVKGMTVEEYYQWAKKSGLPYSQGISEFGHWLHLSYDGTERHENLIATKENGVTKYTPDTA